MSSETMESKNSRRRWLKYWLNPKDKSYMKELPPDDFAMNTVTTVNPYIYLDEIEQAKKEKEYQERVEMANRRRIMQATAIKKRDKVFIKEVNSKAGPGWYQDLSCRQGKKSKNKTQSESCCRSMYRSTNLDALYKHDEEEKERRKVIMGNLERLA